MTIIGRNPQANLPRDDWYMRWLTSNHAHPIQDWYMWPRNRPDWVPHLYGGHACCRNVRFWARAGRYCQT